MCRVARSLVVRAVFFESEPRPVRRYEYGLSKRLRELGAGMEQASYEEHPIWVAVTEFENLLDQAVDGAEAAASGSLGTLRFVATTLRSHAEPSDTGPYSNFALTATNTALGAALQELRNYVSNRNIGHLTNAATNADQVLYNVGSWPTSILKGGAAAQANKVFMEYRGAAEAALKSLRETNQELRDEFIQHKASTDQALAGLTDEFAALTAKITADETRLDTALTTTNDAFTAKQTEREEKFTGWLDEQGKALKELADKDLNVINANRESADTALKEIELLRDDTQTVAGLAAGDQVARGYRKYSLRQWSAGLVAYLVGFVALSAGAAVVVNTFEGISPEDEISWQFAILKLGLTASAVIAAVVAFRLGSHLLAEASTAKRFELELKALGPLFPHDSEQDTLQTVKKDLVERSFGRGWGTSEKSKEVMDEKVIERIAEALGRIFLRPPGQ